MSEHDESVKFEYKAKFEYGPAELAVVVGGQFGSEGKGAVTARLVEDSLEAKWEVLNIRVGGPNAGHTVIDRNGRAWPLRQVPVGAVFPGVQLYIGPGSEIDPTVLLSEVDELILAGHELAGRLFVSAEATVLHKEYQIIESNRGMMGWIGSTGKGIGAARSARIMRTAERVADSPDVIAELERRGLVLWDRQYIPEPETISRRSVIIEGTQGYGLGLHAGHYPYCTSGDCRAIDFMAQAGVSPWDSMFEDVAVWVVARPHPIRVAGNSGPLMGETTWEYLGLRPEYTTVTKKVRRVGEWDPILVSDAVQANGGAPTVRLALTMMDHVFPELYGKGADFVANQRLADQVTAYVEEIEKQVGAQVSMITTGPNSGAFL